MVISERLAYKASFKSPAGYNLWAASQQLTTATEPRVRNTRAMGGGLVPLRHLLPFKR